MVKLWMATLWLYVCCFADGVFLPPNFNAEFSASIFTVSSDCERVFCVATVTSHLTYLRQRAFRGWCVCVCVWFSSDNMRYRNNLDRGHCLCSS